MECATGSIHIALVDDIAPDECEVVCTHACSNPGVIICVRILLEDHTLPFRTLANSVLFVSRDTYMPQAELLFGGVFTGSPLDAL